MPLLTHLGRSEGLLSASLAAMFECPLQGREAHYEEREASDDARQATWSEVETGLKQQAHYFSRDASPSWPQSSMG